jgi:hypothetical protein
MLSSRVGTGAVPIFVSGAGAGNRIQKVVVCNKMVRVHNNGLS